MLRKLPLPRQVTSGMDASLSPRMRPGTGPRIPVLRLVSEWLIILSPSVIRKNRLVSLAGWDAPLPQVPDLRPALGPGGVRPSVGDRPRPDAAVSEPDPSTHLSSHSPGYFSPGLSAHACLSRQDPPPSPSRRAAPPRPCCHPAPVPTPAPATVLRDEGSPPRSRTWPVRQCHHSSLL